VGSGRANEVADALAGYAAARFATDVGVDGEPATAGEGMDNEVYFVTLAGGGLPAEWRAPLVVRVQPDVDRFDVARDEVKVQEWCATVDYPSPRVLAMLAPGEITTASAQVMTRVPGVPMIEALTHPIWKAPQLVTLLAELHVRLHRAPTARGPCPKCHWRGDACGPCTSGSTRSTIPRCATRSRGWRRCSPTSRTTRLSPATATSIRSTSWSTRPR